MNPGLALAKKVYLVLLIVLIIIFLFFFKFFFFFCILQKVFNCSKRFRHYAKTVKLKGLGYEKPTNGIVLTTGLEKNPPPPPKE